MSLEQLEPAQGLARPDTAAASASPDAPPARDAAVLEARGLSFAYGHGHPVFDQVNLSIDRQEIVCLLGESGCGKSTLLKVLAGLAGASTGQVCFLGEVRSAPHPRSALIFQHPSLLPWLSVQGNVGFGLDFRHQPKTARDERDRRVAAALRAVGLADRADAYPAQLSGGMGQRVALARALARQPALLFADEPFSALDAVSRGRMQNLLVDVAHQWHTGVLLVTHDIDEAITVADRVILMGGRPARPCREWRIELPRRRDPGTSAFALLRAEILAALRAVQPDQATTSL